MFIQFHRAAVLIIDHKPRLLCIKPLEEKATDLFTVTTVAGLQYCINIQADCSWKEQLATEQHGTGKNMW